MVDHTVVVMVMVLVVVIFVLLVNDTCSAAGFPWTTKLGRHNAEYVHIRLQDGSERYRRSVGMPEQMNFRFRMKGKDVELRLKRSAATTKVSKQDITNDQKNSNFPLFVIENGTISRTQLPLAQTAAVYENDTMGQLFVVRRNQELADFLLEGVFYDANMDQYQVIPDVYGFHWVHKQDTVKDFRGDYIDNTVSGTDGQNNNSTAAKSRRRRYSRVGRTLAGLEANRLLETRIRHTVKRSAERHRSGHRQKRQTVASYEIELFMVADFKDYKEWLTYYDNNRTQTAMEMHTYYSFIANWISQRYRSIGNVDPYLKIDIVTTGLLIVKSAADSYWTEDNVQTFTPDGRTYLEASSSLEAFRRWIYNRHPSLPDSDHWMLFTGHDIYTNRNPHIAGLAKLGGLCTYNSVSIIEQDNTASVGATAAHELGHSLSARHDGELKDCRDEDNYIMSRKLKTPDVETLASRPWQFSPCSALAFRRFLSNKKCGLIERRNTNFLITELEGGQVFSADLQCQLALGKNSYFGRRLQHVDHYQSMCRRLYCAMPWDPTTFQAIFAMEKTTCGDAKWCVQGKCTPDINAPRALDHCPQGDSPNVNCRTSYCHLYPEHYKNIFCCQTCHRPATQNNFIYSLANAPVHLEAVTKKVASLPEFQPPSSTTTQSVSTTATTTTTTVAAESLTSLSTSTLPLATNTQTVSTATSVENGTAGETTTAGETNTLGETTTAERPSLNVTSTPRTSAPSPATSKTTQSTGVTYPHSSTNTGRSDTARDNGASTSASHHTHRNNKTTDHVINANTTTEAITTSSRGHSTPITHVTSQSRYQPSSVTSSPSSLTENVTTTVSSSLTASDSSLFDVLTGTSFSRSTMSMSRSDSPEDTQSVPANRMALSSLSSSQSPGNTTDTPSSTGTSNVIQSRLTSTPDHSNGGSLVYRTTNTPPPPPSPPPQTVSSQLSSGVFQSNNTAARHDDLPTKTETPGPAMDGSAQDSLVAVHSTNTSTTTIASPALDGVFRHSQSSGDPAPFRSTTSSNPASVSEMLSQYPSNPQELNTQRTHVSYATTSDIVTDANTGIENSQGLTTLSEEAWNGSHQVSINSQAQQQITSPVFSSSSDSMVNRLSTPITNHMGQEATTTQMPGTVKYPHSDGSRNSYTTTEKNGAVSDTISQKPSTDLHNATLMREPIVDNFTAPTFQSPLPDSTESTGAGHSTTITMTSQSPPNPQHREPSDHAGIPRGNTVFTPLESTNQVSISNSPQHSSPPSANITETMANVTETTASASVEYTSPRVTNTNTDVVDQTAHSSATDGSQDAASSQTTRNTEQTNAATTPAAAAAAGAQSTVPLQHTPASVLSTDHNATDQTPPLTGVPSSAGDVRPNTNTNTPTAPPPSSQTSGTPGNAIGQEHSSQTTIDSNNGSRGSVVVSNVVPGAQPPPGPSAERTSAVVAVPDQYPQPVPSLPHSPLSSSHPLTTSSRDPAFNNRYPLVPSEHFHAESDPFDIIPSSPTAESGTGRVGDGYGGQGLRRSLHAGSGGGVANPRQRCLTLCQLFREPTLNSGNGFLDGMSRFFRSRMETTFDRIRQARDRVRHVGDLFRLAPSGDRVAAVHRQDFLLPRMLGRGLRVLRARAMRGG